MYSNAGRMTSSLFQSTRPRGARRNVAGVAARNGSFNPRAHAGRDLQKCRCSLRSAKFQSTRPRGARRTARERGWKGHAVSIHAPTRGATGVDGAAAQIGRCFNPRAHAGRDNYDKKRKNKRNRFNPRAHAGRDIAELNKKARSDEFQSTRPRGARLRPLRSRSWCRSFNPRAHAGRDV